MDGKILVPDQWEDWVWAFSPDNPSQHEHFFVAAGMADFMASAAENLWALDAEGNRICIIEKALALPRRNGTSEGKLSAARGAEGRSGLPRR